TFSRRLRAGFNFVMAVIVVLAGLSLLGLAYLVEQNNRVVQVSDPNLLDAMELEMTVARRVAADRAYYLTKDARFKDEVVRQRAHYDETLSKLQQQGRVR